MCVHEQVKTLRGSSEFICIACKKEISLEQFRAAYYIQEYDGNSIRESSYRNGSIIYFGEQLEYKP